MKAASALQAPFLFGGLACFVWRASCVPRQVFARIRGRDGRTYAPLPPTFLLAPSLICRSGHLSQGVGAAAIAQVAAIRVCDVQETLS